MFFTASHALFAIMIGYGLALMAAYMATHYQKFRRWGLMRRGGVAVLLAMYCLAGRHRQTLLWPGRAKSVLSELPHYIAQAFDKDQYGLPIFANLILLALPIVFIMRLLVYRQRGPVLILLVPVLRHAGLVGPVPLVQERAAQPLVRLLVRPRHVHAAVRHSIRK